MAGDVKVEYLEKEILPFLSPSARPDLRAIAVQYISGLTGTSDGYEFLTKGENYVTALVCLTLDPDAVVKKASCNALINLTAGNAAVEKILYHKDLASSSQIISKWIENIFDIACELADEFCKLVTNVTRPVTGAYAIWEVIKKTEENSAENLINVLCTVNYNPKADLHYLASVLSNMTQVQGFREQLMDRKKLCIQKLFAFLDFQDSEIRRKGVIGALRNCCFHSEHHAWLLSDKVDLLPRLLLPLAGPEEFDEDEMKKLPEDVQYLPPDKLREPCCHIRIMLVEAIIQLCDTKEGRQLVKGKNTYVIMRELHKWERDAACVRTVHSLIDILIGDEPAPEHATLKDVDIPADISEHFEKQAEDEMNA